MRLGFTALALLLYTILTSFRPSASQPGEYFNIARGKKITATATCGYDLPPPGPETELFCKLATVPGKFGIRGLECDHCDPKVTSGKSVKDTKDHRIEYAIDGTERWWQSPPLSRGQQYNKINITIDLGQEFHVAYVVIKTANSPRPGMWILEKSANYGQTYTPWYYFAPSRSECIEYFGINPRIPLEKDDQVLCTSEYSEIPPLENGEMHISLVNGRPSALKNQFSPELREWMRATNVRLRLLKVKTLYGEYLPLAQSDTSVTRRFFYSIKDISIGGRCFCNGYADKCVPGPSPLRTRTCNCQKNTCGPTCSECCPGFVQYKWKSGFEKDAGCEACNCFGHSTKCYYNENVDRANRSYNLAGELKGGGVCIDCEDNTFGSNCQYCRHKYYNPTGVPMTSKDACVPCNCNELYSTGRCYNGEGNCECKENYSGKKCDQCSKGYYGFPDCKPCQCNAAGTKDGQCEAVGNQCPCKENFSGSKCDRCAAGFYIFPYCIKCNCDLQGSFGDRCKVDTGQCDCKPNFQGRNCNQCSNGYFSYPDCQGCSCDSRGVMAEVCNKASGTCICKPGFTGVRCSDCAPGYYGFPQCQACQCSGQGSISPVCDSEGQCQCKPRYAGIKCDQCIGGYYSYPTCIACTCDKEGSTSDYCNPVDGQCQCKENFSGIFCNRCKPGFYGFPNCRECSCNPAGVRPLPGRPLGDCSASNTGQCECKYLVQGKDCGECKPKSFNLRVSNPRGCEQCLCNVAGVIGGIEVCDQVTGHCLCKPRVTSKRCEICKDGYYGLKVSNAFGCSGCGCDIGGSYSQVCGKFTGQCKCRANVGGRACDRPVTNYYHPTLYQIVSEIEDGRTPENTSVRFRFDEKAFPRYSWRGYGIFSEIQTKVIVTVNAKWPGNYHMVFHYALNDSEEATGRVVVRHADGRRVTQDSLVTFKPTVNGSAVTGQFVLVSENGSPTQFALLDGQYDIEFTTKSKKLLLDYVTIVPVFYPGPKKVNEESQNEKEYVLKDIVTRPCVVNGRAKLDDLCIQYSYIGVNKPGFVKVQAENGYTYDRQRGRRVTQVFADNEILKELDFSALALLNKQQNRLNVPDVKVSKSGKYVVLVQYFTTHPRTQILDLYLRRPGERSLARFRLPSCKYTFGCRTVGLSLNGAVEVLDLKADTPYLLTAITGKQGELALDSFILIPYEEWSTDYIVPSKLCVTRMKVCTRTSYSMPTNAVTVEAGVSGEQQNTNKPPNIFDPNAVLVYLKGETTFVKTVVLPDPGDYAIIVHYYQPYHSTIHSETTVNSFGSDRAKTSFKYCPNTSGCRTVVKKLDGSGMFNVRDKTVVDFKIPKDKSLWIDYIMFVPKDNYSPVLANGEPVDRTNDFREYCSKDNLHVTKDDLEFCVKSVFSLTTYYNNGTLPCSCDLRGSRSEKCEEFGGQCPCLENVIGRACTRCKSGYYGFPNCQKCSCDYCDPDSGVCKCPPNTAGEECSCVKGTFGYDPILGCQDCRCDRTGVASGADECDTVSGQCSCLPTRTGRRCDQCKVGYYGYPKCTKCDCDPRGIIGCDANTGKCICKPFVAGVKCDRCKVGSFYLSEENPNGCLECWCSGQTNECIGTSSLAAASVINGTWTVKGALQEVSYERDSNKVIATFADKNASAPLYWAVKLGDKTSAYGSTVTFSVNYSREFLDVPLALIESDGKIMSYKESSSFVLKAGEKKVEISLNQKNWVNSDGSSLSRADFMSALVQLDSLQLLASGVGADGKLSFDFPVMSPAIEDQVESCFCPYNTTGPSCQYCSNGYFKSGEVCVPCQCNNHSSSCDPITGECLNCQHRTTGFKCDSCVPGFFGDPSTGQDDACQPCPCPDSSTGKNFATSCLQRADGSFNCSCQTGYTGQRCQECADGYFGDPLTVGCKPCECNGNIDLNAKGNCDRKTGVCLRCVNNTGGDRCEECQDGYYGDGRLGNCERCDCDVCGSSSTICNRVTGACVCKPGVTGDGCTSCQAGTWDFNSCSGCKACACSEASLDNDCDTNSGQCRCKTGVTGLKCDQCEKEHFGLTDNGCQACNCPTGKVCDINDGRCCNPSDPSCTFCPPYHIRTSTGCEYCGPCEERLFRRVDNMSKNYSINGTGLATEDSKERLSDIQNNLANLTEQVNNYNISINDLDALVGGKEDQASTPGSGEIEDLISSSGEAPTTSEPIPEKTVSSEMNNLNDRTVEIVRKAADLLLRALDVESNAANTKVDALDVEAKLNELFMKSAELLNDTKAVLESVRGGVSNITHVLENTVKILIIIQGRNYTELRKLAESEYKLAFNASKHSNIRLNETNYLYNEILKYRPRLLDLNATFRNQIERSLKTMVTSMEGATLNNLAKTYKSEFIIEKAKAKKEVVDDGLVEAQTNLQEAKDILNKIKFQNYSGNSSDIYLLLKFIDENIANLSKENDELQKLVNNATIHAYNLKNLSDYLQSLLSDPQKFAKKAIDAVNAYTKVADTIKKVLEYAREADNNGGKALEMSTGLGLNAIVSKNRSTSLDEDAKKTSKKIPELEDWLKRLEDLIKKIRNNFQNANKTLAEVKKPFTKFDNLTETIGKGVVEVKRKAEVAKNESDEAKSVVDKIKIPSLKRLEEGYDNISNLLTYTEELVDGNNQNIYDIETGVENVTKKHDEIEEIIQTEVVDRIMRIRFNIERGREKIRNLAGVAAEYDRTTSAELKIPEVAYGPSIRTRVSFDFKSAQSNALLLFLGNSEEYMAFEIDDGYLQVVYANGPDKRKVVNKNSRVNQNGWTKVQLKKTGTSIDLTVNGTASVTDELPSSSSTFTIERNDSILFVGAPPAYFALPDGLKDTSLVGGFYDLYINARKIGLYDTKNYTVPPRQLKPATLTEEQKKKNAYKEKEKYFFGDGFNYVGNFDPLPYDESSFIIRSASNNGLILFAKLKGEQYAKSYLLIEMVNGTIGLRYNISTTESQSRFTKKRYNDNKDHKILLQTSVDHILLIVDDEKVKIEMKLPRSNQKGAYFGGVKRSLGFHKIITTPGFIGCIKSIFSNNKENSFRTWDYMNVNAGCDVDIGSRASFNDGDITLNVEDAEFSSESQIGFAFQTFENDSLLYNLENEEGEHITIGIEGGKIKIQGVFGGEVFGEDSSSRRRREVSPKPKLNDGKWHSVVLRRKNGVIKVLVDNIVVATYKLKNPSATFKTGMEIQFSS